MPDFLCDITATGILSGISINSWGTLETRLQGWIVPIMYLHYIKIYLLIYSFYKHLIYITYFIREINSVDFLELYLASS